MTQPLEDFTTDDLGRGYWKADDPRRIRDRAITAPGPGSYVLDHQPGHIELWKVDGDEPELTDVALWD